ncbi:MAG: hypothetical protein QF464_06105 [Myxococcota bacterium]|nr:hypothetical protein [Myxococcota bacterium]
MSRHTHTVRLVAVALVAAVGCMDGPIAHHQGDRGYPCDGHEDCLTPLLCLTVPAADFPVCTGSELEGDPCDSDSACAWIRDDRGLPLRCTDAVCAFPGSEVVP